MKNMVEWDASEITDNRTHKEKQKHAAFSEGVRARSVNKQGNPPYPGHDNLNEAWMKGYASKAADQAVGDQLYERQTKQNKKG